MIGFRLLAIILGLVCLASAGVLVFHEYPLLAEANTFFIRNFIPDAGVQAFIKSPAREAVAVKNIVRYIFSGYAVLALGMGLLFFCAAVNPLRMRPFIVVVMIGSILWIAGAIWKGVSLDIYKTWWISDAAGALILLVLLIALFPKKKPAADQSAPEMGKE
ncbi:MAG: hypothetical protein V1789_07830 [PVC group bacterium]